MSQLQLIATAPMGLEAIVSYELKQLGYEEQIVENGRVLFYGNEADICRCNLWLRTSDRILVLVGKFEARTFEQLFEQTRALPWSEWIPQDAEFPVQGRSQKSQLSSVPACQSIVKKAIVEKMKEAYHQEWFEESGALYKVEVALLKDQAWLTIDTTGPSLHKRGYRQMVTEAPLKETMAAALIYISRWKPHQPLYDPFCGSGTIPIEAAMIAWNIAPGLRRTFPSERWLSRVTEAMWDEAREEAYDALKEDVTLDIAGSDIDASAIEVAQVALKSAGLSKEVRLRTMPIAKVDISTERGIIITNPPYGERLSDEIEVEKLIRQLGNLHRQLESWSTYALSPTKSFERYFGHPADRRRKLYNGRIECQYYQYRYTKKTKE